MHASYCTLIHFCFKQTISAYQAKYYNTDFVECYRCDTGYFCPNGVELPYEPGTYNNLFGGVKYRNCLPGDYTEYEGSTFCFRIHKGEYSTSISTLPLPCPSETYIDQTAQKRYRPCKEDYYNEFSRSTYCVKCPPGHSCPEKQLNHYYVLVENIADYFNKRNVEECKTGWFTTGTGSLECTNDTSLLGSIIG